MFTLAFDRQRRVVLARFSGELGRADIGAFDHAFERFIDVEGCAHLVIDFTAVSAVAMPDQALAERGKRPLRCPDYHRIVVAPQPEISELYRLFSANQMMVGSTAPKIVKTMQHALVHLGVGEPDFRPIETPSPSQVVRLRKQRKPAGLFAPISRHAAMKARGDGLQLLWHRVPRPRRPRRRRG